MSLEMSKVLESLVSYSEINFEEDKDINTYNKEYHGNFNSMQYLHLPKDKGVVDILTDNDINKPTQMILHMLDTCSSNLDSNEHSNMLAEEYKKTLSV